MSIINHDGVLLVGSVDSSCPWWDTNRRNIAARRSLNRIAQTHHGRDAVLFL